jgi:AcrR family transcriptional regulator
MPRNAESLKKELAAFKRERIVAAAAQLFYEGGYETTTVEAIAAHLHTTKQFIYAYFDSKTDILFAVCRSGSLHALDVAEQATAMQADAVTKLRALIEGFVRVVCRDKLSVAVFIREEKNLGDEHAIDIAMRRRSFDTLLQSILDEGIVSGQFEVAGGPATTRLISGMVNFTYSWFNPDRMLSVETLAGLAADLAIKMVKAPT